MKFSHLILSLTLSAATIALPLQPAYATSARAQLSDEDRRDEQINHLIRHIEKYTAYIKDEEEYIKRKFSGDLSFLIDYYQLNISSLEGWVKDLQNIKSGQSSAEALFLKVSRSHHENTQNRVLELESKASSSRRETNGIGMVSKDRVTTLPEQLESTDLSFFLSLSDTDVHQSHTYMLRGLYNIVGTEGLTDLMRRIIAVTPSLWPLLIGETEDLGNPDEHAKLNKVVVDGKVIHEVNGWVENELWENYLASDTWQKSTIKDGKKGFVIVRSNAYERSLQDRSWEKYQKIPALQYPKWLMPKTTLTLAPAPIKTQTVASSGKGENTNKRKVENNSKSSNKEVAQPQQITLSNQEGEKAPGFLTLAPTISKSKKRRDKKRANAQNNNSSSNNAAAQPQDSTCSDQNKKDVSISLSLLPAAPEAEAPRSGVDIKKESKTPNAPLTMLDEKPMEIDEEHVEVLDLAQNLDQLTLNEKEVASKHPAEPVFSPHNIDSKGNEVATDAKSTQPAIKPAKVTTQPTQSAIKPRKENTQRTKASVDKENVENAPAPAAIETLQGQYLPPRGMRMFHGNAPMQYRTLITLNQLSGTHFKTWQNLFDPEAWTNVSYGQVASLWRHINGKKSINERKGSSHKGLLDADKKNVAGVFSHGDDMTYTKRTIPYVRDPFVRIGFAPQNY
ncbi:MAG: hypothetical protein ACTHJ4_05515 [Candidatus Nucleicultricaceae bacterium]